MSEDGGQGSEEQDEGYRAESAPQRGIGAKETAPGADKAIKKNIVFGVSGAILFLLIFVAMNSLEPADRVVRSSSKNQAGRTSGRLSGLPKDYSDARFRRKPGVPPKSKQAPPELSRMRLNEAYLKWLQEQEKRRLEREAQARSSAISFNLQYPRREAASTTVRASLPRKDSVVGEGGTPFSVGASTRDVANRQDEKQAFLTNGRPTDSHSLEAIEELPSKFTVQAGTIVPGLLLTGINTDLPGKIIGQVSQSVFDSPTGRYLLIPQGSKVLGDYDSRITFGQERALVVWSRLIFPNGSSISLEAMPGTDLSGYSGLSGSVDRHFGDILIATFVGSGISAGARIVQGDNRVLDPSFSQLATQGVAQQVSQVGQEFVGKTLARQPTIKVAPGERFNILVTKDFILRPYEE